jgi:Zn-finger nucleic acid-binding protein
MNQQKFECPKCKKPTLSNFNTSEGVVVDFCDQCFGIWFDKDELANYIELSKDIPEIKEMKKQARKTDLSCPKCKGALEELPFSSQTNILVDRCENCGGIFFDAGEIVEAEKASATLEKLEDRMKTVVKRFAEQGYQPV